METNETAQRSTEHSHHHHHSSHSTSSSGHHHHHHSSRRRRLKVIRQRATLIGFTTMAFLMILVFVYASMYDIIEIWPLLFKTVPLAAAGGAFVGLVYYVYARWQYNKERHS